MKDDPMPIPGRTYEAWAIWNQCQGVFTDAVFHWRCDAQAVLADYGPDAKVVPVTMTVDPRDGWWKREWDADEWEKLHRIGKYAPKPQGTDVNGADL